MCKQAHTQAFGKSIFILLCTGGQLCVHVFANHPLRLSPSSRRGHGGSEVLDMPGSPSRKVESDRARMCWKVASGSMGMGSSQPTTPTNQSRAAESQNRRVWLVLCSHPWQNGSIQGRALAGGQACGSELGIFSHPVTRTRMERREATGAGTGLGVNSWARNSWSQSPQLPPRGLCADRPQECCLPSVPFWGPELV